jgi:rfaE bifunctional protein kinase chain/domain
MNRDRFESLAEQFPRLRIALVGDFFLDRYFEIDPRRAETSIETGLPVYNVVEVRSQPGAAGTVLNNLVALGVGSIHPVGFCGDDGEGYELRRALQRQPGVQLEHFVTTTQRRTPVYGKPLVLVPGMLPRELNRLDFKNWTPTPEPLQHDLAGRVWALADAVDAFLVLEQVDRPDTGVTTPPVREALDRVQRHRPSAIILADSRQGLSHFPPLTFKLNAHELARMTGRPECRLDDVGVQAEALARRQGQSIYVTLAEQGIVGAEPRRAADRVPAFPIRGPIDVVGAGDAVSATLACALAAGATAREAMELAMAAASIVVHQIGTTGTASVPELAALLGFVTTATDV